MIPRLQTLLKVTETVPFLGRRFNCWTAGITSKHRKNYLRTYPVTLVLPDGSSINIPYSDPRGIIVLPHDIQLMSEEQRKIILHRRLPRKKINVVREEYMDDFDENQYLNLTKKINRS